MPGPSLQQIIGGVTPHMVWCALRYYIRSAIRLVQLTQPDLHGLAYWQAVLKTIWAPDKPELPPYEAFEQLGDVLSIQVDERKRVIIHTEHGVLRLVLLAPDLVQITASKGQMPEAMFSYAVAKPEEEWSPIEVNISETENLVEINSGALKILVDKQPCSLTIQDKSGKSLLRKLGVGYHPDSQQTICRANYDKQTAYYGLGEKTGSLNRAGRKFELWNSDPLNYDPGIDPIYMSIPFLVSLVDGKAAGLFFDNSYRSWVDLGASRPGTLEYRALNGDFRLYVMVGTPRTVLERYTELTGRMSLLPLWALGFQQSRWSYIPQSRLMEIARTFRERCIPCDALYLDIDYMDGFRCFTWNLKHFPSPPQMLADLHDQGFKVVTIVDPGIKIDPAYKVYQDGLARKYFLTYPDGEPFNGPVWPGDCHFPDFSDPQARYWWGDNHRELLEAGVDGIWNDMNEIALITGFPRQVPDIVRHSKEGQGAEHAEIHNVYGLLMTRACKEGQQRLCPDRRPFLLTRSGWAGVQRYSMHWTGDNTSTWQHLGLHIQMVLTLGMSGVAMTSADVGGFSGGPGPELYTRWMQTGAFMPFFRVHSMKGSPNQEPWSFGPQVEEICRKYIELRYRLLPYSYTAMWQAAQSGAPLVRPLFWNNPEDTRAYAIQDQFLYGDAFLVAPVITPGVTRRAVYLPDGVWFNFWTHEPIPGGQMISVDAPLDILPLFVRGGAVISLWPLQQYIGEKPVEALELQVYLTSESTTSQLYEDDGSTTNYDSPEAYRLSDFTLQSNLDGSGGLRRVIRQGGYTPAYSRLKIRLIGLGCAPMSIELAGGELLSQAYDAGTGVLHLEINASGDFELHWR